MEIFAKCLVRVHCPLWEVFLSGHASRVKRTVSFWKIRRKCDEQEHRFMPPSHQKGIHGKKDVIEMLQALKLAQNMPNQQVTFKNSENFTFQAVFVTIWPGLTLCFFSLTFFFFLICLDFC